MWLNPQETADFLEISLLGNLIFWPVQTYKYMFYKAKACFITKNKVSKSFSVTELSLNVCAS